MVLRDETPCITLGSMGGDAQPQIHIQLRSAMIDFEKNAQQAVSVPGWRSGRFQVVSGVTSTKLPWQAGVDAYLTRDMIEDMPLENRIWAQVALRLDLLGHRTTLTGP